MSNSVVPTPIPQSLLDNPPKLIVTDMDGTLLDDSKELPESFWPLIDSLLEQGIHFAPASGRQCATLQRQFAPIADRISFIAENGNFVVHQGQVVFATSISPEVVRTVIGAIRTYNEQRVNVGRNPLALVVCGHRSAYVERYPDSFGIDRQAEQQALDEAAKYYVELQVLDNVLTCLDTDKVVKLALFDDEDVELETAPMLRAQSDELQGVISGKHWLDMIVATANKGTALRDLQAALGVSPAETVCFVDYLNDIELLDHAEHSFAMSNGHPEIIRRSACVAPSNAEHGVITTLKTIYGI